MAVNGIKKVSAVNTTQILANTQLFHSIGVVVAQSVGVEVGKKKIAKAGTPLTGDLNTRTTAFTDANANGSDVKGILLHDVDVTDGDANATLLVFGFVNLNMVDTTVESTKLVDEVKKALPMISFIKY